MTIAAWPSGVPYQIVKGSFRLIAPARPPKRTDFEDGPKRGRRSSTKNIATIGFDLALMPDELTTFMLFERDDLIDGTLPFTMPVRVAGGSYAERTVEFVGQNDDASYTAAGGVGLLTTVSIVLDVEDYVTAPEAP
jgi:hypothetical protein